MIFKLFGTSEDPHAKTDSNYDGKDEPSRPEPDLATSPGADVLLLTEADMADLLSVTRGVVRRLDAGGKLPSPIRLGNFTRWRRTEIQDWVDAGCPSREGWHWKLP